MNSGAASQLWFYLSVNSQMCLKYTAGLLHTHPAEWFFRRIHMTSVCQLSLNIQQEMAASLTHTYSSLSHAHILFCMYWKMVVQKLQDASLIFVQFSLELLLLKPRQIYTTARSINMLLYTVVTVTKNCLRWVGVAFCFEISKMSVTLEIKIYFLYFLVVAITKKPLMKHIFFLTKSLIDNKS